MTTRRRHTAAFKAQVALEAAKEVKTLNELASQFGVHPVQIAKWKKQLLENIANLFIVNASKKDLSLVKRLDELYRQIGEVTVERDWLKKKLHLLE
jgi:transposase-like protein